MEKEDMFPVVQVTGRLSGFLEKSENLFFPEKAIVPEKTADKILVQLTILLAANVTFRIEQFFHAIVEQKTITKDELAKLLLFVVVCKPSLGCKLFSQVSYEDHVTIFSAQEAWDLIGEVRKEKRLTITSHDKYEMYEGFTWRNKEDEFPIGILREWVKECCELPGKFEGRKWAAKLMIALYNKRDTELITPETIIDYLETHVVFDPHSHGIHRLISLLGYGAQEKERGWYLYPYQKRLAGILFQVLLAVEKSYIDSSFKSEQLNLDVALLAEIFASYEDKEFSKGVIRELYVRLANVRRNIRKEALFLHKHCKALGIA